MLRHTLVIEGDRGIEAADLLERNGFTVSEVRRSDKPRRTRVEAALEEKKRLEDEISEYLDLMDTIPFDVRIGDQDYQVRKVDLGFDSWKCEIQSRLHFVTVHVKRDEKGCLSIAYTSGTGDTLALLQELPDFLAGEA
jgi:hypothetical protein